MGMDGQAPSTTPLLYRRLSGCYLTEGSPVDSAALQNMISVHNPEPEHRAFAFLCTAIAAGARSIPAARALAQAGFHALGEITVARLPLALELTKIQLLALCLDAAACLEPLPDLTAQWIDLLWARAIAQENDLDEACRILRTPEGHFITQPPQSIHISNQILEDCIGSDSPVRTQLAFRTYARLWNTELTYPVPESLPELLQRRLAENWDLLG